MLQIMLRSLADVWCLSPNRCGRVRQLIWTSATFMLDCVCRRVFFAVGRGDVLLDSGCPCSLIMS